MSILLRRAIATTSFVTAAAVVHADELLPNLVPLGDRIFDVSVDVSLVGAPFADERPFIPFRSIQWLDQLVRSDEVLGRTLMYIREVDPTNPVGGAGNHSAYVEGAAIPTEIAIPGYLIRPLAGEKDRFSFVPLNVRDEYSVNCVGLLRLRTGLPYCEVSIPYPPDLSVGLEVQVNRVDPWPEVSASFDEIAYRAREIAYCLDVTDEIKMGVPPDLDPEPDMESFLASCRDRLVN